MAMHNMDDVLTQQANPDVATESKPDQEIPVAEVSEKEVEISEKPTENEEPEQKLTFLEQYQKDKEEYLSKPDQESVESDESESDSEQKNEKVDRKTSKAEENSEDLDEFGSKTEKPRTYTEEEVQRMIRERLARGQHAQQQQVAPIQQAAQDFKADPASEESWEQQLETFVTNTVHKLGQKQQQEQWQQQEQRTQAEFETRFTAGMARYKDFQEVVRDKPITNGIMMAARSMKDPAAFVYAASKQQPKELERIAQIQDPYQLAAEVGRLEERMRKAKTVSAAPKPGSKTKSDMSEKYTAKVTVDDKILEHAKRKLGRR